MLNNSQFIVKKFNLAAKQYMQLAKIQIDPALKIIDLLRLHYNEGKILDLGSGPGTLQHNKAVTLPTIAFDLSLEMLKNSSVNNRVNGDASSLPFGSDTFSIIISNLMLQWPQNKQLVLKEAYRVLKPGGKLILTTLIEPSLHELNQAWLTVDDKPHTLKFLNKDKYEFDLANAGFNKIQSSTWQNIVNFPDLHTLLKHFKDTGTNLDKSYSNTGLGGRTKLKNLKSAYQRQALSSGDLPLTYAYLLIVAEK